jgi:hypothetical protein
LGTCSCQLSQLRLRLLQPVRHPHLAVHRRRRREVLLGLLALARAPVELAEAEVAVGDEGAHAARLGECQRLAVVALGFSHISWIAPRGHITEQTKSVDLVAAPRSEPY